MKFVSGKGRADQRPRPPPGQTVRPATRRAKACSNITTRRASGIAVGLSTSTQPRGAGRSTRTSAPARIIAAQALAMQELLLESNGGQAP